jgi:hypothetical protein
MPGDAKFKPQKEINHFKTQIKRSEKEKEKTFPALGMAAYRSFQEGRVSEPALVELCNRLQSLDNDIAKAREEIERLQALAEQMKAAGTDAGTVSCPHCMAPARFGSKYCGNCGKELGLTVGVPAWSCPACGQPVAGGARFCGECGALIPAAPAPTSTPAPPFATGPGSPPPPPPPAAPTAEPEAPRVGFTPIEPEKAPPKCPSCGALVDGPGAAFCGECGARLG